MAGNGTNPLGAKWRQVVTSRKVWAGLLGTVITLGLWALGEIDGAQAVAALAWVLGIFIGAVAVEDGLRNVLSGVVEPVTERSPMQRADEDDGGDAYGYGPSRR